jgi:putative YphP/YqiW family bacilliredoxin
MLLFYSLKNLCGCFGIFVQIRITTMYPEYLVAPMRADLTNAGFEELKDAEAVTSAIESEGTVLVMVNSVCGCAAANARPAAKIAAQNEKHPTKLVTVFAGMEKDAVDKARAYMLPYPPSSPAMALFKDGKLVHIIERHQIEGRPAQMIADNLIGAFEQYC